MQIQIIDVGTPNTHAAKNGRTYQSLEITYKGNDGKVSAKKLMSFSNPSVFKAAGSWNKGDTVDIVTQKDDAGYWQWTGIGDGASAPTQSAAPAASGGGTATRVTGSNYETKEERAARQVMIVRQSSISSAIAAQSVGGKGPLAPEAVIEYAKQLEAYVLGKAVDEAVDFDSLEDDIPL
jgi:hypothetical protein